ncbi:hypothetical protein VNO78_08663 [Psophocarpus tetragonolobus]|uniref:Uncharacterized protein n=1 Tax=Psophocarpus tetragonolobus TaxID=3891 RepID=A0AAN9SVD3_PSOTE
MVGFYDLSDSESESESDNECAVEEIMSQAQDAVVLEQVSAINCSGFSDSVLPSHLETRFRNLKSFPPSKTKPPTSVQSSNHQSPHFSPSKHSGHPSASLSSSDESSLSSIFRPSQKDSPLRSSHSPSPPRWIACFWFSPKKNKSKKILRKPIKEQDKLLRHAHKIVKQASASFNLPHHHDLTH